MHSITIENFKIGPEHPPFVIAEISANHNQSFERAIQLIEASKASGAHAVKLQTYTPDTMTLNIRDNEFVIQDPESLWYGRSLYDLYQEAHTPWEWHQPLFQRCRELDLIAFSTPFDETAIDFLETQHVPCYKIASLEITHLPLIRKAAATGKPLFISTGAATLAEIDDAVRVARQAGCQELILLKCTAAYPAPPKASNLMTIRHMSESFDTQVGLSDHTAGIGAAVAASALGACAIEKHFTLARDDGGVDAAFSLEPEEMRALVIESKRAWEAIGQVQYGVAAEEKSIALLRRSLYFVKDLKAGQMITPEHIKAIRPGLGLSPKEYDRIIGLSVKKDVKRGEAVQWKHIQ